MRPVSLLLALVLFFAAVADAAPTPPRPYSGCGVLAPLPEPGSERAVLILYKEPGVARMAEVDAAQLPRVSGSESAPLLTATARRGAWLRLPYDDAGREGWVEAGRFWRYLSWEEFLPGRRVAILPAMKKGLYAVRVKPAEAAPEIATLARDQAARVLRVQDDWALLDSPPGWFRWRDGDGRLTVALQQEER